MIPTESPNFVLPRGIRVAASRDRHWTVWDIDRSWLAPLLVLFLLKQLFLVVIVGPFAGHDEVDHFWYADRLARGHGLGVVGSVDLPAQAAPYRRYVADYPTNAEVIQPPLYHALAAPLLWLVPGGVLADLYALRLVAVGLGAVVVWLAYLTARLLFPTEPLLRAGVPLFVAFQPQFSFEAAIVNHDILVIALASVVLYLGLLGVRDGIRPRDATHLGLVVAAGLWTKTSFGLLLPIVAGAVLFAWWDGPRGARALGLALIRAVGVPAVLMLPWFARSYWHYGDPTGAGRLAAIPGFGEQAQSYGEMLTAPGFWRQILEDFWGNYGWRQVPFDPETFRAIWLTWGVAVAGLLVAAARAAVGWRRPGLTPFQRRGLLLVVMKVLLMAFGVLYVGTIQFTQARFAFPAMIGIGMISLLGLKGWLPARARAGALPLLLAALMGLNVLVTLRFLLPFYTGAAGIIDP